LTERRKLDEVELLAEKKKAREQIEGNANGKEKDISERRC
jgi:hypothetical protein